MRCARVLAIGAVLLGLGLITASVAVWSALRHYDF